jgi:hypothetical protein
MNRATSTLRQCAPERGKSAHSISVVTGKKKRGLGRPAATSPRWSRRGVPTLDQFEGYPERTTSVTEEDLLVRVQRFDVGRKSYEPRRQTYADA